MVNPKLADLILARNNKLPYLAGVFANPFKGTVLHKITQATAEAEAALFEKLSVEMKIPLPFWLACVCEESIFDDKCQNGNFSFGAHIGSNPSKDPDGFDMGLCQLKIKYLMESEKLDLKSAYVFALDITKALPYMGRTMLGLLEYADKLIESGKGDSSILPAFGNRFLTGTCAYNFGRGSVKDDGTETGMLHIFHTADSIPNHGIQVMDLERTFATQLGLPSVFEDIK